MKRAINFRIAAFAAFGLVCGILFSYNLYFGNKARAIVWSIVALAVFSAFVFFSTAKFKGAGKFLCLLFFTGIFAVGGANFYLLANDYENADLGGHSLTVHGKVSEIAPDENRTGIILSDVTFSGAINGRSYYRIYLYVYGENGLRPGDRITFTSVIKDRTLTYNGKFSASSLAQGIKYYAETDISAITVTESSPDVFERCNLYIFDTLKAGLKESGFSVAYAMLTGNSDYIAEEDVAAYRAAGVAHIFAVSGLHVGFLATVLYFALKKIRLNEIAAFIITLACCTFYSGVCGFSASSLRAVIMFFFLNIARIIGLKYDGISAICAAAFAILVFFPAQLFCAGFQLSFAAVTSITVLFVPLKKLMKFLPDKLSSALAVAFAAEVGGIPVLLSFFGKFATLSMFVNLLLIPVVGVLFVLLMAGTVLGGIISPAACLFLPEYALFGLNFIISAVNFRIFLAGGFTLGVFAAAYYGVIGVSGGLINLRKTAKAALCVALAVVCVAGTCVENVIKNGKLRITVIGSENLSAVFMTLKGESALIISDIDYRNFSQYRLEKASENAGDVTVVMLNGDYNADIAALTVRLRYVFNVTRIYYYGERDTDTETVLTKTFDDLTVSNFTDGDGFGFGGGRCGFYLGGKCLICSANGNNTAVFSTLAAWEELPEIPLSPDTAVCFDKHDTVSKTYKPERTFSFREKYGYADGETQGNLTASV